MGHCTGAVGQRSRSSSMKIQLLFGYFQDAIHKFYENLATFQYKNIAACQVEPEIEVCVEFIFLIEIKEEVNIRIAEGGQIG